MTYGQAGSRPVVVGIDFSDSSLAAARWAAAHLEPDAPLVLLHAVHIPTPPRFLRGVFPPIAPIIEDATRGATQRVQELADALERDARVEVRAGKPEDVLADAADELAAGLVVLGAHRERQGIWRALGGTPDRVARRLHCSLLLARGLPAGDFRKALVAVDDSDAAPVVLQWASRFAAGDPERVVLLHVVSGALAGAVRVGARGAEARRADDSLREHASLWLRDLAAAAGLGESPRTIALGDAAMEIVRASKRSGIDVVAVGAHGEGRGPFLGSTTEFVLRQGTGPVFVIRAEDEPAAAG